VIKARRRHRIGAILVGVLGAAGIAGSAEAQPATPNLEGVWKIAAPTSTLKPVSGPPKPKD
jgi:hypothetical protein